MWNIQQLEWLHTLGKSRTTPFSTSDASMPSSSFSLKSYLSRSDSAHSCAPVSGIIITIILFWSPNKKHRQLIDKIMPSQEVEEGRSR